MRDLKSMGCGIDWRRRHVCGMVFWCVRVCVWRRWGCRCGWVGRWVGDCWAHVTPAQLAAANCTCLPAPACSFITTDVNPYYDSFVRWQFNVLHKQVRALALSRCCA